MRKHEESGENIEKHGKRRDKVEKTGGMHGYTGKI